MVHPFSRPFQQNLHGSAPNILKLSKHIGLFGVNRPMQKAAAAMVLRWGIIGCGDVTEVKSGPAFKSAENSKLVAVMRRDAEKAKDYAERHQVPKWYNTLEGILTDPEVGSMWGLFGLSKVGGICRKKHWKPNLNLMDDGVMLIVLVVLLISMA